MARRGDFVPLLNRVEEEEEAILRLLAGVRAAGAGGLYLCVHVACATVLRRQIILLLLLLPLRSGGPEIAFRSPNDRPTDIIFEGVSRNTLLTVLAHSFSGGRSCSSSE